MNPDSELPSGQSASGERDDHAAGQPGVYHAPAEGKNATARITEAADAFHALLVELQRGGFHPELDVAYSNIRLAKLAALDWAAQKRG